MTKTENDLFVPDFIMPEHRGGDGWTILHGDALDIIPHFQPGAFDAVITDPPYAGGGAKPSEKTRTTNQKYSSMSADKALPDFERPTELDAVDSRLDEQGPRCLQARRANLRIH